jgi:hypothetical protein
MEKKNRYRNPFQYQILNRYHIFKSMLAYMILRALQEKQTARRRVVITGIAYMNQKVKIGLDLRYPHLVPSV